MSKAKYWSYFIVAALAAAGGAYMRPAPELKVEYRDRIVEQTKIQTRIVHVRAPDGSERTETIIVDGSTSTRDSRTSILKATKAQYVVGVGVAARISEWDQPKYNLLVARRIVGPVFVGLTASTDKQIGALLSIEF